MIGRWLRVTAQPPQHRVEIPDWPVFAGLTEAECTRLRGLAEALLQTKRWVRPQGHPDAIPPEQANTIACLAALPVLELSLDWYRDWQTIILYPGGFQSLLVEEDEAGIVHEWFEERSGEAWPGGPTVLSWDDVAAARTGEGPNVVIHEMAHRLDACRGAVNGFPPLPRSMDPAHWTQVFTEAFDRLNDRLDRDDPPPLDAYAAEDPGEFFAVTSEWFFECPADLIAFAPQVFGQLRAFYGQDPHRRGATPPAPTV